ncbi:hypothetical protein [Desulfolutivibrio sulfoxidireducens]|uniref:hypothetical protein n=1 Tax=Desulfolutivibrio sulfoxidireducens TaxID=2773299 RepID=UPI00159DC38D|nr:hypothetical protein [Desulfolutivibrio sulfoxidireducens]QLA15400.1 hypothetical protein GD605_04210 [Desulfolutivibrio sulfoxidireducens]QLA18996.1 hypothetical protein GD604_04240 [Desulfolutivibrio sulfoxidireducens]
MKRGWLVVAALVVAAAVTLGTGTLWAVQENVPEITGEVWIKSSQPEKLAFLVGAGSVVAIEHHIDLKEADDPSRFTQGWVEAFKDKKWAEIAKQIDDYFAANPDKTDRLVVEVIWRELIAPNMKIQEAKQ